MSNYTHTRYPRGSREQKRALKPLASGFYCCLFSIIGDLDYFAGILQLPHFASKSNPCPLCRASSTGPNTWANFRPDAPWRATVWDPVGWREWEQRSQSPLFRLPGTSCHTVCLDYLHTKYLGSDQFMFGSVLALLTHTVLPATPLENLKRVWARVLHFYKASRTPAANRFRSLGKLSMFVRRTGYPKLRGKGHELKHFGRALLDVWQHFHNPVIRIHQQILLMLQLNVRMEDLLLDHKTCFVFPPAAAQEFRETASAMLVLYAAVARHFAENLGGVYRHMSFEGLLCVLVLYYVWLCI